MDVAQEVEQLARAWVAGGEPPEQLLSLWRLGYLKWMGPLELSDDARALVAASWAAQPSDALDGLLRERRTPVGSDLPYKLENLAICWCGGAFLHEPGVRTCPRCGRPLAG